MKSKRVVLTISICVLMIVLILGFEVKQFQPRKMIVDRDAIDSVSVKYHGSKIDVDADKLISILEHYNAKKTTHDYSPYSSEQIDIEIDFNENHRFRHILLGEFNIWYESGDTFYNILDVEKLKSELRGIIKENVR